MTAEFTLLGTAGAARRGRLKLAHGTVETPAFMPLGTGGTVKAMLPQSVAETGAEIVLGNTFHLMLRPGAERVAAQGGLHKFMNWPQPILTDSGGFQVMSLKDLRKLDPDGVTFRSPFDGSEHRLTPERSIEIQHLLDTNITMSFDECTSWPVEQDAAAAANAEFFGQFGMLEGVNHFQADVFLHAVQAGHVIEFDAGLFFDDPLRCRFFSLALGGRFARLAAATTANLRLAAIFFFGFFAIARQLEQFGRHVTTALLELFALGFLGEKRHRPRCFKEINARGIPLAGAARVETLLSIAFESIPGNFRHSFS